MPRCDGMGKLVFGMMQSLDGYVAGVAGGPGSDGYVAGLASGLELPPPGDSLSRHFNEYVRGLAGLSPHYPISTFQIQLTDFLPCVGFLRFPRPKFPVREPCRFR